MVLLAGGEAPTGKEKQSRYFVSSTTMNMNAFLRDISIFFSMSFSQVSMTTAMKCYSQLINFRIQKNKGVALYFAIYNIPAYL